MRPDKLEQGVLVVTALALTAMLFYFLGSRSASAPVLISAEETPTATASAATGTEGLPSAGTEEPEADPFPIDLNTATVEELMLLPSIGETRANAIVDYREENGPFASVEELCEVKGIGEGILAQIMDYVTVEDSNG